MSEEYSVEDKLNKLKNNTPKLKGHKEFNQRQEESEEEIEEIELDEEEDDTTLEDLKENLYKKSFLNKSQKVTMKRNTNCKLSGGNK